MTTISIILPTYNRLERLQHVITGLEQQTYPLDHVDVIIISDGSTDGTDDYLRAHASPLRITPVTQPNSGPSVARNNGIAHATGDIVVFLDDDVVPMPRWLAEHMRIHDQQPNAVVLGPMLSPPGFAMRPWVRWEQAMLMKQYVHMSEGAWQPSARQFYTGNTSLARRHLLHVGGFDDTLRRAEDVELAYRLARHGVEFIFNAEAVGLHYAERSFESWMKTPYLYGRADVIFGRDKGNTWLLPELYEEFHKRHALVRMLATLCIDRPPIRHSVLATLQAIATHTERLNWERPTNQAYSALFNVLYYQGLSDEFGGWQHFLRNQGATHGHAAIQRPGVSYESQSTRNTHQVEL